MTVLYIIGTIVTVGLTIYLVWALFRPEDFS
ncbi:MAG: K(+)-transporting ATPase subunit F [Betaproteobacteria bacterium]|nr:K(+)-transporting ATPase subunit F [Betaproteobacteria bacterium]MBV9360373.1 K(+)-transporting ATPase subunit F [Betaproteobacteria bacterium]